VCVCVCVCAGPLTINVVAGHELEHLINEDDGEGELQHHHPLFHVQMGQLEDHLRDSRRLVRHNSHSLPASLALSFSVWSSSEPSLLTHCPSLYSHTVSVCLSIHQSILTHSLSISIAVYISISTRPLSRPIHCLFTHPPLSLY